jgi:hypothetical protein
MTEPSALVLEIDDTTMEGAGVTNVVMLPCGGGLEDDGEVNTVLVTTAAVDDEDDEEGEEEGVLAGVSAGDGGWLGHCEKSVVMGETEVMS